MRREPQPDDQEETEKVFKMLINFIDSYPEIEPNIWAGALWSTLVNGYLNSDLEYEEFVEDWKEAVEHYKQWFDDKGK